MTPSGSNHREVGGDIAFDVLDRYLRDEATPADTGVIAAWARRNANAWALLRTTRDTLRDDGGIDAPAALRKIREAIDADGRPAQFGERVAVRRFQAASQGSPNVRRRIWAVSALVATGTAFIAMTLRPDRALRNTHDARSTKTYVTRTGQQATLTLMDGTRVTLGPRTTLRVPAFDDHARTVILEGEAQFDVRHATGAPFIVRTGDVSTRVLGTTFSVRRYHTDVTTCVAVQAGKVVVVPTPRPEQGLMLTAGRMGVVSDSGAIRAESITHYTEWMDGQLIFRDAPATDVLATLTRWYGYQFRLVDPALAKKTLTVSISTRSSVEALSTLKYYLDAQLTFEGNVITLTPRRRPVVPTQTPRDRPDALITRTREVGR